jgi:hypothetical protein
MICEKKNYIYDPIFLPGLICTCMKYAGYLRISTLVRLIYCFYICYSFPAGQGA